MIDTDKYEGHTPAPWSFKGYQGLELANETHSVVELNYDPRLSINGVVNMQLIADAPLLLAEVKRLQSEPTVTVDDYHKKGHLYVTVHFPDGEHYVGLVEKWEGDEE